MTTGCEYPVGDEPDLVSTTKLERLMSTDPQNKHTPECNRRFNTGGPYVCTCGCDFTANEDTRLWRLQDVYNEALELVRHIGVATAYITHEGRQIPFYQLADAVAQMELMMQKQAASTTDTASTQPPALMSEPPTETATPMRQEGIRVKSNPDGTISDETWASVWYEGYVAQVEKTEKLREQIRKQSRQEGSGCEWRLWTGTRCGLQRSASLHSGIKYCQGHNDLVLAKRIEDELRKKNKKLKRRIRELKHLIVVTERQEAENNPCITCQDTDTVGAIPMLGGSPSPCPFCGSIGALGETWSWEDGWFWHRCPLKWGARIVSVPTDNPVSDQPTTYTDTERGIWGSQDDGGIPT